MTQEEQAFENMRMQVRDLELKARYWEAQWKIKYYSLEDDKISADYNEYVKKEMEAREKMMKDFQEQIDKMNADPNVELTKDGKPVTTELQEVENGSR
jgi:hypothetical protein